MSFGLYACRVHSSDGLSDVSGRRNPVARATAVIAWFTDNGPVEIGLRDLAAELRWPPSTLQRVLGLLEEEGLLSMDPHSQRYRLGLRVLSLALSVPRSFPLVSVAFPVMRRLVDACAETALLAAYDRARMETTYIEAVECSQSVRFVADVVGQPNPLYAGTAGLAVLAFLGDRDVTHYLDHTELRPITGRTITDRTLLEGELERVRRRGFARSSGQYTVGAVGIGAPILGPDGLPVAALLLTMPEYRFDPSREDELGTAVREHAAEIGALLGAP
jgi:IclR family transcriptional regulator, acetate operon repressor